MISTSNIEDTYTVEDFIELGKDIDDIQYLLFFLKHQVMLKIQYYMQSIMLFMIMKKNLKDYL